MTPSPTATPGGLVTSGGIGQHRHAMLAYREHGRPRPRHRRPNVVKPETGHPAFDKACHLFGIELRRAPIDPVTTQVDVAAMAAPRRRRDDRPDRIGLQLRLRHHRPDRGAVGAGRRARRRPPRRRLPRRVHPAVRRGARLRHPHLRLPPARCHHASRPTPTSTATPSRARRWCCSATSRCATRSTSSSPTGPAGKYCSPGIDGSRSGGPARRHLGLDGPARSRRLPRATPRRSSRRRSPCRRRCARTPSCGIIGDPTFLLQLHLRRVRHLPRQRLHAGAGLALQRPAVPQRHPHGGHPAADPAGRGRGVRQPTWPTAVAYAKEQGHEPAASGAIYGGVAGGMNDEADEFIRMVMDDMMDQQLSVPDA